MKNKILLIITLLSMSISYIFTNPFFMVISIILSYGIILFKKFNEGINYVFMLMPLAGIYDGLDFKYLFNISIGVLFIRLMLENIIYKRPIVNKITICFIILIVWNIIVTLSSNIPEKNIFSNISLYCSWIIFSLILFRDDLNYNNMLTYFIIGYFLSCLLCGVSIVDKWGFDIPSNYRFIGLVRDANYFATYSLIVIFGFKNYIVRLICVGFGLLSTSKMFLLLLVLGLFATMIFKLKESFKQRQKLDLVKLRVPMMIFVIGLTILLASGFLSTILEKYISRFLKYDLTTGRMDIQIEYLKQFVSNPISFLFGRGLNYRMYYSVPFGHETNMIAHSTYLDVLLGFGVLGLGIFVYMLYKLSKKYVCFNPKALVLLMIFALTLFALSYLSADLFAFLLIIVLLSFKKNNDAKPDILE